MANLSNVAPSTLSQSVATDLNKELGYIPMTIGYGTNVVSISYVLRTSLLDTKWNDLGILKIDPAAFDPVASKAVLQPNNIKPCRVNLVDPGTGTNESSFCDESKIGTAKAAGWRRAAKNRRGLYRTDTKLSELWYATVNGIKIGYILKKGKSATLTTALTALGMTKAKAGDVPTIIMGAKFPTLGTVEGKDGINLPVDPTKYGDAVLDNYVSFKPGKQTKMEFFCSL